MAFSDFFKKVKVLLQGDSDEEDEREVYAEEEEKTEPFYPGARYQQKETGASARLAQRMANEYYDENEDEDDGYGDYDDEPVRVYPDYDDNEEDDDDGFADDDRYSGQEDDDPFAEQPEDQPAPEDSLPSRTEVTLLEIKRLSDRLDEETLRRYQMHLVKIKKETGAVSALTALRVLHEYVDDDDADDDDGYPVGSDIPDLSAN